MADRVQRDGIDCDWRRRPSYAYLTGRPRARPSAEAEAAAEAGLPASFADDTGLPYAVAGAVRFDDQAEFHPRKYLLALADGLERVYERSHAVDVDVDERCAVKTPGGRVTADRIVVATHFPFLDRSLAFAARAPAALLRARVPDRRRAAARHVHLRRLPHPLDPRDPRRRRGAADGRRRGAPHRRGRQHGGEVRGARALRARALGRAVGRVPLVEPGQHDDRHAPLRRRHRARRRPRADGHRLREVGHDRRDRGGAHPRRAPAGARRARTPTCSTPTGSTCAPPQRASSRRTPRPACTSWATASSTAAHARSRSSRPARATSCACGARRSRAIAATTARSSRCRRSAPTSAARSTGIRAERSWDCPCHGSRFSPEGDVLQGPAVHRLEHKPVE